MLTITSGFSSNTNIGTYKVEDEKAKLTIEEMNAYVVPGGKWRHDQTNTSPSYDMYKDIDEVMAQRRGSEFAEKWSRGLPFGLQLAGGVVVGAKL